MQSQLLAKRRSLTNQPARWRKSLRKPHQQIWSLVNLSERLHHRPSSRSPKFQEVCLPLSSFNRKLIHSILIGSSGIIRDRCLSTLNSSWTLWMVWLISSLSHLQVLKRTRRKAHTLSNLSLWEKFHRLNTSSITMFTWRSHLRCQERLISSSLDRILCPCGR